MLRVVCKKKKAVLTMSNVTGFTNTQKIKEEAALWLLKIEEESPLSDEKIAELRQWVNSSDIHRKIITRMSKTWGDMDVLTAMMSPTITHKPTPIKFFKTWVLSPIFTFVYLFKQLLSTSVKILSLPKNIRATAVLSSMLCVWLVMPWQGFNTAGIPDNIYVTSIGEHAKYTLPDGSTLWLNSSSEVEVQYSAKYRRISLREGEAHFDVIKDPTRPFEVYSQGRLVRAVGTAFSVYKIENRIEVFVSEGTVELAIVDKTFIITPDDSSDKNIPTGSKSKVSQNALEAPVKQYLGQLEAGQSISITDVDKLAIMSNQNKIIQLDPGEIVRKLSWLDGKLVFAGESLQEVVTEISRHTSMRIDIPDPILKKMRIGGHFQAGETDALFIVLESGFGIHVNKLGKNHVELTTK